MIRDAIYAAAKGELVGIFNKDTAEQVAEAIAKSGEKKVADAVIKMISEGVKVKSPKKQRRQPKPPKPAVEAAVEAPAEEAPVVVGNGEESSPLDRAHARHENNRIEL